MKIVFLTSKLNFESSGGSVEEFDLMMRTLLEMGHEVTAVTAFSEGNKGHEGVPYRVMEEYVSGRGLIGIQIGAYKLLKKYESRADVLHIDGHNFLYGAGFYRRFGGKRPISAFFNRELGSFPEDESVLLNLVRHSILKRLKRMVRWLFERTLGMWLASAIDVQEFITPMYEQMYRDFGLRGKTSMILGDPTDFKKIRADNNILPGEYSDRLKRDGKLKIFFSSRMAPGKGFDLLLAGFARITDKSRFELVLGGDGPEEKAIKSLTTSLGLDSYVRFTGWMTREMLYSEFKSADIFVQVGWRKEGASMTLLYAMAFGLPSILPMGSGMAWQAGGSALEVQNGDHEGLARAIERLAAEPDLRAELSAKAERRLSDDQMDHRKVIARWVSLMEAARS